ncbi:MAG: hypothetical protein ABT01_04315 [Clostridium sp. SCN 57-10]|nr:MAG: hypothetical protein ABT01_04315 [Clostridium sp. SCN 57-10]
MSFTTSAYDVKSTRARLYANAGYNGRGVLYQSRKDLNIYHGAYIGVSRAYPENGVPDAWLFCVGMSTEINPKNPPATTGEELRIDGKEVYFDFYRKHFEDSQRDPFVVLNYTFLYDDRNYTFDFGIRIEPTLSKEKQDELLAEMKQHCLEEAVKIYDSLEYIQKAKKS